MSCHKSYQELSSLLEVSQGLGLSEARLFRRMLSSVSSISVNTGLSFGVWLGLNLVRLHRLPFSLGGRAQCRHDLPVLTRRPVTAWHGVEGQWFLR